VRWQRLLVATALAAPLTGALGPAAAHSCSRPVEVPVGEPTVVSIAVSAEAEPVVQVAARIPDGFTVESVTKTGSWQAEQDGATVRWRGGSVIAFGCDYLSVRGTATEKGRLVFPVTTTTADGTIRELRSTDPADEDAAQVVFAGVPVGTGDGGGSSSGIVAGAAAITAVLIGTGVWAARRGGAEAVPTSRRPPNRGGAKARQPRKRRRPARKR
jgi:hypothetical protein